MLIFNSCNFFTKENKIVYTAKPLARVYDKYLYDSELDQILNEKNTSEDSTTITQKYIDSWIRQQLLLREAEQFMDVNLENIQRKVDQYRYSLLVYEYEKQFLNNHLDTVVRFEEVNRYYKEHKDNFLLKQNIIMGVYIKLPVETPNVDKIKKWIFSEKEHDRKELFSYCLQFASYFSLDDTIWHNFSEIVEGSPFAQIQNPVHFLETNNFSTSKDSTHIYFLRWTDYKMQDEVSPLPFVKNAISNTIIQRRKQAILNQLSNQIYEAAGKNKNFEVYKKTNE